MRIVVMSDSHTAYGRVLDITPGGIMPVHRTIEHKISETIR